MVVVLANGITEGIFHALRVNGAYRHRHGDRDVY